MALLDLQGLELAPEQQSGDHSSHCHGGGSEQSLLLC
jgi:hypothetical protein